MQRTLARSRGSLSAACALIASVALAAAGCDSECTSITPNGQDDAGPREITVELGTAGGGDGLQFERLPAGGKIPLETFGQGGTHATIAVRAHGLGTNVAFFDVSLENTLTGDVVSTVPSSKPQLWICDDDRQVCDQLPVHVMTGGLAEPGIENRDGLRVIVTADVRDQMGRHGSGSQEGVLHWMPPPPRDGGIRDAGRRDEDGGDDELDGGE